MNVRKLKFASVCNSAMNQLRPHPGFLVCISQPRLLRTVAPVRSKHDSGCQSRSTRWQRLRRLPLVSYIASLKWTPIPLGLGFALIAYQQYWHVRRREIRKQGDKLDPVLASNWEVSCYRMLPLKTLSRFWGWVNNLELPVWARTPVISLYVKSFGCDISEAQVEDLKQYRNLGEFFRRPIKPDVRPVDHRNCVTSPADGKVMHFGLVHDNHMEQVKGVSYSLPTFLGASTWWTQQETTTLTDSAYQKSLLTNEQNKLYHCIIYLAPGDYHCFHSPVDWEVRFRRHFSGELLSVNPGVASWIPGLFSLNERAVYVGKWKHGFFSMTAVGATNVGSIKVRFDRDLSTNVRGWKKGTHHDHSFMHPSGRGIGINKGDFFGEFNLGSTIVLVFEAPAEFAFDLECGQKIKFGQSLSCICATDENVQTLKCS